MTDLSTSSTRSAPNFQGTLGWLDGFVLHLRAQGRADKTVHTYTSSLALLQGFTERRGMPALPNLSTEHLREFFNELFERGNKASTVSVRYRALQQFYKWLLIEGERTDNPLDRIPAPKIPETLQPHYTPEQLQKVLSQIPPTTRDVTKLRNRAVLLTLADTGLRGGEICGLRTEDLDLRDLTLKVMKGKAGKQRIVGFGAVTAQAIERYLRRRDDQSPWLFAARGGRTLSFNALRLLIERLFVAAGVEFKGVHGFRRGFAISFLDLGGDPEDLRTLAGWDSPQMLRRYTKATETERALKSYRRFSPVDRMTHG